MAKYDHFLFIHEDILFKTDNWGSNLIKLIKNPKNGVIGVAGSSYTPFAPQGYNNPIKKYNFYNLIQHHKDGSTLRYEVLPGRNVKIQGVDGVLMAIEKTKFEKSKFNENLDGFHGYDLEFSLKVSQSYENKITTEILIEHFSQGSINKQYLLNNIQIRKSFIIDNVINDPSNEYFAYINFINSIKRNNINWIKRLKLSIKFISPKRLKLLNSIRAITYFSKELLRK